MVNLSVWYLRNKAWYSGTILEWMQITSEKYISIRVAAAIVKDDKSGILYVIEVDGNISLATTRPN